MKILLCISLLTLYSIGFANESLTVEGTDYQITKLGKYYHLSPKNLKLRVKTSLNSLNCNKIDRFLTRFERQIESCKESPESYRCESLQTLLEEQLHGPSPSMANPKINFELTIQGDIPHNISFIAASRLQVNQSLVKIQSDYSFPFIGQELSINNIQFLENSRVKRIAHLIDTKDALELDQTYSTLVSYNRYMSCDILNSDIKLELGLSHEVSHTERETNSRKKNGYKVYQQLKKLRLNYQYSKEVQSAYIGYEIGKSIEGNMSLSIRELFNKFYSKNDHHLKLKTFSNQNNFEEQVFPDRTYAQTIEQSLLLGE